MTTAAITTKPWADTPFTLLTTPRSLLNGSPESPASRNATEMCLIHNILLRGLNCIYNQCTSAELRFSEDIADFISFCDAWSCVLHSHHKTEEEVYFPLLDSMCSEGKKGVEAKNHAEHETFLPGLARFDAFVNSWKDGEREEGKVAWDGKILKSLIDDFGPKLASHLSSEIVSLESLASDEAIDWELLGKTMAAHSKKVADRVREVPFLIVNSDVKYEDGIHGERFPPFPWAVHQIFRWVYIPQLKAAWKFASCDDWGVRKELALA